MPVGDIPEDMSASEYYPQEELIFGGKENDQSDKIKQFISRCEFLAKFLSTKFKDITKILKWAAVDSYLSAPNLLLIKIKYQRCYCYFSGSVCESPSAVMAIHSFSSSVPSCPEKWEELWIGFSLMMVCQHFVMSRIM